MSDTPATPRTPYVPEGTRLSTGINLAISAAGAGVLSFPFAFLQQGVALGTLLTLVFACFNIFTLAVLVHFTLLLHRRGELRARTYEELCLHMLGERAYVAAVLCIVIGTVGALTGFFIIVGDIAVPVLVRALGPDAWLASRGALILLFATLVVLPLSLLRNLAELAVSSFISVLSVLAVSGVVVYRSATHPVAADVELLAQPSISIVFGVPIAIFSLGCHLQVVPLATEMREPAYRTDGHIAVVCAAASFACCVLYVVTGACGYVAFGAATQQDVLLNFPGTGDIAADVAKALMALHIVLAAPVVLFPGTQCVAFLVRRFFVQQRRGKGSRCTCATRACACLYGERMAVAAAAGAVAVATAAAVAGETTSDGSGTMDSQTVPPNKNGARPFRFRLACSAPLIAMCGVLAVYAPEVAVLFAVVGATVSTAEIYIFPALMMLAADRARANSRSLAQPPTVFGLLRGTANDGCDSRSSVSEGRIGANGASNTSTSTAGASSSGRRSSSRGRHTTDPGRVALLAQPTSHVMQDEELTPSLGSKLLESRSAAFVLLGLGSIVMVLGTTVVIYEQF